MSKLFQRDINSHFRTGKKTSIGVRDWGWKQNGDDPVLVLWKYSWPSNNMHLNCMRPLIRDFFSKTLILFMVWGWESTDAESWLYALINDILYRRLVRPWILLSVGVLEPIPFRYQGKTYTRILTVSGWCP